MWWRRALTVGALGVGGWAVDVTLNDDWDEFLRVTKTGAPWVQKPRVVVLGTGWAAASFLKKLDLSQFDVTVVSPRNYFLFTPMLAGSTVGTVEQRSIVEPIRSVMQRTAADDAVYIQAECTAIDPVDSTIQCRSASSKPLDGEVTEFSIDYDHLIVACGSQPATYGTPGVAENALFMKELDDSKRIRDRIADCLEAASLPGQSSDTVSKLLHFVVVGGGPSGVEFAAELHDFLKDDVSRLYPKLPIEQIRITLFDVMPHVLGMFDSKLVEYTEDQLRREGITLRTSTKVVAVEPHSLTVQDNAGESKVPFGTLVWVAGITSRPVVRDLVNALDQKSSRGLMVDPHLKVLGTNNIWAIGDCGLSPTNNPPTAQVASQEGRYLGRLFNQVAEDAYDCAVTGTKSPVEFSAAVAEQPSFAYVHKGAFAYIGDNRALAQIPSGEDALKLEGRSVYIAWRTVYFSKLLSTRNRMMVGIDWIKTRLFGRDSSRT